MNIILECICLHPWPAWDLYLPKCALEIVTMYTSGKFDHAFGTLMRG